MKKLLLVIINVIDQWDCSRGPSIGLSSELWRNFINEMPHIIWNNLSQITIFRMVFCKLDNNQQKIKLRLSFLWKIKRAYAHPLTDFHMFTSNSSSNRSARKTTTQTPAFAYSAQWNVETRVKNRGERERDFLDRIVWEWNYALALPLTVSYANRR